ncbi:MAG: transglutaminase-like domain-containing protein [Armatimonadota bacterium]|nr:transglutaminase-like domain-containing protein [Armatimonadota bacterium]
MIDKQQLPFLIKLVDDPSPTVRAKVAQKLRVFGSSVWQEIEHLHLEVSEEQRSVLAEILHAHDNAALKSAWRSWQKMDDDGERLEEALRLLANWQMGQGSGARLRRLLDGLAEEFTHAGIVPHATALSLFLFEKKGLHGASEDYYNPLNSNLVYVIETGQGIPITLACIFILVGKRLGIPIHGLAFPGHFLAHAHDGTREMVFDCFDGGRLLSGAEMVALRKAAPEAMRMPVTAITIIARVVRNLANAYYQANDTDKARFILSLLSGLELPEHQKRS